MSGESQVAHVQMAVFLLCLHMVKGARDLSGVPFLRALILFLKAMLSLSNYLPEAPTPQINILMVRISTYEFGLGVGRHSAYSTIYSKKFELCFGHY